MGYSVNNNNFLLINNFTFSSLMLIQSPYVEPNEYNTTASLCRECDTLEFFLTVLTFVILLFVGGYMRKFRFYKSALAGNIIIILSLGYVIVFSKYPLFDVLISGFSLVIFLYMVFMAFMFLVFAPISLLVEYVKDRNSKY